MEDVKKWIADYFGGHGYNTYWLPIYAELMGLYARIMNTEYTKPYVQEYLTVLGLSGANKGRDEQLALCRGVILSKIEVPDIGCSSGDDAIERFLFWAIEDVHARNQSVVMSKLTGELAELEKKKREVLSKMAEATNVTADFNGLLKEVK